MKNITFLSVNFHFWVVKFSVYLNRHVFAVTDLDAHMSKKSTFLYADSLSAP